MVKRLWIFLLITGTATAQSAEIFERSSDLLHSLPEETRHEAQYSFDNAERFNWHFVPRSRNGVALRDLNASQRNAVFSLLKSSLSETGFQKARSIVGLELVLRKVEGRGDNDTYRDPLNYYVTFFGHPHRTGAWAWRFEGHHIALNFTTVDNQLESSTPSFFGSNPAIVKSGPERGKQVLKDESELGFKLLKSFSEDQRRKVMISEQALPEILSFNSRKAVPIMPVGLTYREMGDEQRKLLLTLLRVYVGNYELGFSTRLMAKIERAGLENLSFAWAGGRNEGEAYYYRIQGPMLLIELDNTQNNANHIHSVVRDLTNDFADDILREHYEREHTPR